MRLRARLDPNVVLAAAAAVVVLLEVGFRETESIAWIVLELAVGGAALLYAWSVQERLRLVPVLATVAGLQLALLAVHLGLDAIADKDSGVVFRWQGNTLLRGEYPRSEYPLGAVLLFALEAWIGGGTTRTSHALLMVPFGVAVSAAIWLTNLRYAPWLAALVGLWPANAYHWQYKFDLAPAALLVLGLLLALRGRWAVAGVAFGVGALVKWTPALAALALVAWLVANRRVREAAVHAGAAIATVAVVHAPFLVWRPSEVAAAYTRQTGRSLTPESVWYLLLRPFDLAHVRTHISFSAGAPRWANVAAAAVQVLVVLALVAAAATSRSQRAAVALAALTPVAFLLLNRIFSPQFLLVAFAGWAFAAALVVRTRREQLAVGFALALAAGANAFVYPYALPFYDTTWVVASAVLFTAALGATVWLAERARRAPRERDVDLLPAGGNVS